MAVAVVQHQAVRLPWFNRSQHIHYITIPAGVLTAYQTPRALMN